MPYRWHDTAPEQSGAVFRLEIWPHRSLPARGFVWVIGLTATGLALPLLALLGTTELWGLLPFALLAIWALWVAIRRSYAAPREELVMDARSLHLRRSDPGRPDRVWQANPYWLRLALHADGPVEDYLTLTDGQREIELGAFLAPEERVALHDELAERLRRLR
ncbi:DUF2244 domain-containing protein [Paracoccus limosus]|uniref:DUF2244 domain-containing protein n=1 Tax=Paracoccus limosus TaxID=913252 RepID=A0A844H4H0_9RHOB|nr:DUF2244 domain-containing protein [Paracoccus limosus]MTH34141.1 DUF2244 domain-containing protein [Paracoccus limosus]